MLFSGKMALTSFKLIRKEHVGGVLENSGYLLQDGHWDFQNWRRNDWENEASSCLPSILNFPKYPLHALFFSDKVEAS